MKGGVETGDLRHVWQSLENRFDGRQIVWLMQWGQWNELLQLSQDLTVHNSGLGVPRSAMNHAVADAQDARPAILGAEPACQRIQRLASIANTRVQHLIGE